MKHILFCLTIFILGTLQSCSGFFVGAFGYEKPTKRSNKYYNSDFKVTNPKLKLCRKYVDLENKGLSSDQTLGYTHFVFFENGFVLQDRDCMTNSDKKSTNSLKYSEIYSESVGSYAVKGDTIYWGTRPGYLKKKMMVYYKAIVSDSGLVVISTSKPVKSKFFSLQ